MKRIPRLASVMTPFPYSVDIELPAEEALRLMRAHQFHHLPVTRDFKPISLVSALDIETRAKEKQCSPSDFKVGEVCQQEPYLADLNSPVDTVVEQMADRHLNAVVVTRGEKIAGIFTSVDACRLLGQYLRGEGPIPDSVA